MRILIGLLFCGGMTVFAQRLEFEVATVKPNADKGPVGGASPVRTGDLVALHNVHIFSVIYYAYHLTGNYQVVGYGPQAEAYNWFDIDAKASPGAMDEQLRLMFQALLEERFHLKVHREKRDLDGYELTLAGGKARLVKASDGPFVVTAQGKSINQRPGTCSTTGWEEGSHMVCHAVGIQKVLDQLSGLLTAPVADRTGLTGSYDIHVLYMPDERVLDPNTPAGASLPDALQDQAGLKLVKKKGPVEVLVIDHFEKPTEN